MSFVVNFSGFFKTRSSFNDHNARCYLAGLMQGRHGAKNIERMEEIVPDFNYEDIQNFITDSPWDFRPLMDEIALQADGLLGGCGRSRLVIDETYFQKKGDKSVGVARQYNGRLGKVENSQVAVFTSLASGQQATFVDVRFYLPEEWTDNPQRCEKAGVPEDCREHQTKAQLALESVKHCRELGLRFDLVSFDSGYGSQPWLLYSLNEAKEIFVAEVHCDQRIWTDCPWNHREGARPGKELKKARASMPPMRIDEWAQKQAEDQWKRLKVRDSDQGWVEVNYLASRIWVSHEGDERLWWGLVWENPDDPKGRRHYALSNAGADEDPCRLVADGVERNVVERNFRDSKSEAGLADYQVRGWLAWHHHVSLVMLAMLFLLKEKIVHTSTQLLPPLTVGDIVFVLERLLPSRNQDQEEVMKMLDVRRRKRFEDQRRRKTKTVRQRPPLLPDEILPK